MEITENNNKPAHNCYLYNKQKAVRVIINLVNAYGLFRGYSCKTITLLNYSLRVINITLLAKESRPAEAILETVCLASFSIPRFGLEAAIGIDLLSQINFYIIHGSKP